MTHHHRSLNASHTDAAGVRIHSRLHEQPVPSGFATRLRDRRAALLDRRSHGQSRYVPVLSALAPVMTQAEGEITYPGDPMCLYSALSVAVHRAVNDAGPLADATHYNDLAPDWTRFPSIDYRLAVHDDGYRPYTDSPNTDQTVFDPRVWDTRARERWVILLRRMQPRVVLISSVSPAHRYALELATMAKAEVPEAVVVLGGRHVDETVTYAQAEGALRLAPSSPLAVMKNASAPPVFDIVVSGEAYYALDVLMRALALSIDLERRWVEPSAVRENLEALLASEPAIPGTALIVLAQADETHAYPISGAPVVLTSLPSPYEAFAIRSRFDIFPDANTGKLLRTAHLIVSSSCPYRCNFCSESAQLAAGALKKMSCAAGAERVCEYVGYGAESVFFDDSVFWSGTFRDAHEFCAHLRELRETPLERLPQRIRRHLRTERDHSRLRKLQWGAQFTVDVLAAMHGPERSSALLSAMRDVGCSYIYLGIESMSAQVMGHIHKNLRRDGDQSWADKVRTAARLVKESGMRVGTSVLFGLSGEDRRSIDETIDGVAALIDDGLVDLASPNILTYHPATPITRIDGMAEKIDYHSPNIDNRKPYIYFEEAFPGVISTRLTEDDLWYIHEHTARRWGVNRNSAAPPAVAEIELSVTA